MTRTIKFAMFAAAIGLTLAPASAAVSANAASANDVYANTVDQGTNDTAVAPIASTGTATHENADNLVVAVRR